MKSRIINTVGTIGQQLPRRFPRISQAGLALTGTVCMLTLSGCYYPYGYYPGGYYPYYATVPANTTQQDVQVGPPDSQAAQLTQQPPVSAQQRAQNAQQNPPPAYTVAAVPPPVYVAPPYPAYYPPPVYPAYYGYPGWYGPSVSIGFGFGGYWGGGRGYWGGGHGHWH